MGGIRSYSKRSMAVALAFTLIWLLGALSAAYAIELVPTGQAIVTSPSSSARGIALSPDEKTIYIGGIQDRSVVKLDLATGATAKADLTVIDPGAYGKSAWVASDGVVWAPLTTPFLAAYSPNLELKASFDLRPFGITNPEGAAVSPTGDIYVTDLNKSKPGIYKFRLENGKLVLVGNWGNNGYVAMSGLRVPAFTPAGDLLLCVYNTGEINLVRASDGQVTLFSKSAKSPYYLAVDAQGKVYVAHYDRKDAGVSILSSDGALLQSWTLAQLGAEKEISGIAVSQDGKRLYVEDQRTANGGRVLMFTIQ